MNLTLVSNQNDTATLALQDDNDQHIYADASFKETQVGSSDATMFTASVNSDGSIVVVGVAPGAGKLGIGTKVSYKNSLGVDVVDEAKSLTIDVTITAVPTANGTTLIASFGAPVLNA